jgi:prepilin-type N-terminal cleavage/methylation domain-containing protein
VGGFQTKIRLTNRRGFNMIEMIVVMIVVGLVIAIAAPRVKDGMAKINVREAKVSMANYVARTRGSAVARGCRTVLHMTQGTTGKVWITSCKASDVGRSLAVDTVGTVDQVADRYAVSLYSSVDSIAFDRRGIATTFAFSTIRLTDTKYATIKDSLRVNPIGKVVLR